MNDSILVAAMQTSVAAAEIDWQTIIIVTLVIFMPMLVMFCYLGYRRYLHHQRQQLNDELILRLAQQGQTLTPELIDAVRKDEKKGNTTKSKEKTLNEAYNRICTGSALLLGGVVLCLRNRVLGCMMLIASFFVIAQGVALWLSGRESDSHHDEHKEDSVSLE